jgi:hypothetical protein
VSQLVETGLSQLVETGVSQLVETGVSQLVETGVDPVTLRRSLRILSVCTHSRTCSVIAMRL